ncbi:hypothetical protein P154DRAFT_524594 [Amniculicola lignicola CBS 123094]|uniref:Uncharacterized protein n=1 Tax=Amniculicola lignicola CBS 123094 TaxID=1392246 RepID=A0A6A5WJ82_9PLEO|nr:hypothetical protein P154DRAFT_524594 [Amniculicola lignicola CBS 123094]
MSTIMFLFATLLSLITPASALELKDKAAIGIAVPLGVILCIIVWAFYYSNTRKRKRGVVEDLELEEAAKNAPPPKVIQWKPGGNY